MIKSFIIITLTMFFTATLSGQTVVKMAMPEQSDEPISATTLFGEILPLEVPTFLGPMGYDVLGGMAPYSWRWLENENILSENDIATITPTAGNDYSVVILDNNNCSVTLPIKTSSEGLKIRGSESSLVTFSIGADNNLTVKLSNPFSPEVTIQLIDIKGIKHFETRISNDAIIPVHINTGMYFVYVQGQDIQYVQKIMVP